MQSRNIFPLRPRDSEDDTPHQPRTPPSLIVRLPVPEIMSEALSDREQLEMEQRAKEQQGKTSLTFGPHVPDSLIVKLKMPLFGVLSFGDEDKGNDDEDAKIQRQDAGDANEHAGQGEAATIDDGGGVLEGLDGHGWHERDLQEQAAWDVIYAYAAGSPSGAGGICTVM